MSHPSSKMEQRAIVDFVIDQLPYPYGTTGHFYQDAQGRTWVLANRGFTYPVWCAYDELGNRLKIGLPNGPRGGFRPIPTKRQLERMLDELGPSAKLNFDWD